MKTDIMNTMDAIKMVDIFKSILKDVPHRTVDKNNSILSFDIKMFDQLWGSTALGFGGIGGSAMTNALTCVFIPHDNVANVENCMVYFGGQYAYSVPMNDIVMKDIENCNMVSIGEYRSKYLS